MMTLDKLQIGKDAIIDKVTTLEPALRQHILDMGLTPGTEVTLIKVAPMGDPIEIRVRGYELTLRKSDASLITLKDIHTAHNHQTQNPTLKNITHPGIGETKTYRPHKSGSVIPDGQTIKLALVGNQNCGKTTLFNQLTGSNQRVGNFPGVTVDRKDGFIKNHKEAVVTDLPGIYSLSPYTSEEVVTREFILNEKPDAIINILDATNIERNLYLTMQLLELNIPMVLALNMMDEVKLNSGSIDINTIEKTLGVPVVPISASKNEGVSELVEHILYVAKYKLKPGRVDFCPNTGLDNGALHRCIHAVAHLIEDHCQKNNLPIRFCSTKIVEGDKLILEKLKLDFNEISTLNSMIKQMENESNKDRVSALADMRFKFIEELCNKTVVKPKESLEHIRSVKADKILTGKYTAIPAFLSILGIIFYLTFGVIGKFLSDLLELGISSFTNLVDTLLTSYNINPFIHSLIIDGVFSGVGSVLSFLPIIVVLFFFLSILEDSGYMARIAFVMDRLLRKIGLSGRSFVPMLIGFGCSVPAILSTRTLPSERDRKMTILLTPFMSCSAKLPIYAFFTAFFFKKHQALVMVLMYVIGILVGILFALTLNKSAYKGNPVPFVMELPNYRLPSYKNVLNLIWDKAKDFLTKAFTIIFLATIIIWFLQTFDMRLNIVSDSSQSILAHLGGLISPIFRPLGFDDWRISTALITGFTAKESVVSTLTVLINGNLNTLNTIFTPFSSFVFLVFTLLYTPCVAAIGAVKREIGRNGALIVVIAQCLIAWLVAFAVNILGHLLNLA